LIETKINGKMLYFNNKAFKKYDSTKGNVRGYLDYNLGLLSMLTADVQNEFPHVDSFYVSSTYRKPKAKWSPHEEGRAIDVSRFYIEDKAYYLIETQYREEWKYFAELCGKYFQKGLYNQVLCPYDIWDMRRLHVSKIEKLKNSHQDHFHLNIGRNSI